jgi:hypothetical protein
MPRKKLTITLDARVYEGLHAVIGRRRISRFIEVLVRPHVLGKTLDAAYREMARDEAREAEALDWAEAMVGDVAEGAKRTARPARGKRRRSERAP